MADDVVRFRHLGQRYDDSARPDDSSFLPRNLADRLSQIFLMIEGDIGDHAQAGIDDIGRIETSAHADFQHDDVGACPRKIFESHCGQHFEKAGMPGEFAFADQALGGPADYVVQLREIVVAKGLAVEADTFVDPNQVRRSVEAGLES